jgi:5-methylthioadenosine/S-adenosylhomocysteine deaminase
MESKMTDAVAKTTLFRNCDWIVAWDEAEKSHVYLRNADFVIRGADIVHVGSG